MIDKLAQALINNVILKDKPYEIFDKETKGLLIRVPPTGRCVFYFSFNALNGKKARVKIGLAKRNGVGDFTVPQARKIAEKYRVMRSEGIDPRDEIKSRKQEAKIKETKTFCYFVENYYNDYIDRHHKTRDISKLYMNYFIDVWGDVPIQDININHLEAYRNKRLKIGRKPSTINREMNVLQGAFSRAVDWDMIEKSPFIKLKNLRTDKTGITRYLSEIEEKFLRDTLKKRDQAKRSQRRSSNKWHEKRGYNIHVESLDNYTYVDYLEPTVLLTINTGMRKGEALSLKWEDINFDQKMLTLKASNTKSSQTRNIPLNKEAYNILSVWWDERYTKQDGYVFINLLTGDKLKDIKRAWKEVLKEANIKNFRFHDLRHTFASKLAMKEVDLNAIRELLGHSNISMVLRYAHLSPKHLKKAVDKLI